MSRTLQRIVIIGVALGALLACGRDFKHEDQLAARGRDEIMHLNQVKRVDDEVGAYINECSRSESFRVRAKLGPLLERAVYLKAMKPENAKAKFNDLAQKDPLNASFWKVCADHVDRIVATGKP